MGKNLVVELLSWTTSAGFRGFLSHAYTPNTPFGFGCHADFYRLSPCFAKEFYKTYKIGKEQLLIFVITVVTTLATDLLVGIAVGILTKLIVHLANGLPIRYMFKPLFSVNQREETEYIVDVYHSAVFSNYIKLKSLDALPKKPI